MFILYPHVIILENRSLVFLIGALEILRSSGDSVLLAILCLSSSRVLERSLRIALSLARLSSESKR